MTDQLVTGRLRESDPGHPGEPATGRQRDSNLEGLGNWPCEEVGGSTVRGN